MSRVVKPVRPKAVSWYRLGNVVMHHRNISTWPNVSLENPQVERLLPYLEAQDFVADGSEMPGAVW